jgi:CheY-like chemotaxis protein
MAKPPSQNALKSGERSLGDFRIFTRNPFGLVVFARAKIGVAGVGRIRVAGDDHWPSGQGGTMRALRILLVEDDSVISMFLGMTLEQMGHDVCAIESTEAGAVAAAERHRPDLMIVDATLSAGDGIAAVVRILAHRAVRYVFASGDMTKVKARFPDAVVIQKPFNDTDLARAIQKAMDAAPAS